MQHAVLRDLDQEDVDGKVADVEHQRRRRADHHEDRERDPEEDREGSPEISDVLRHDEQANDARHGAAENQEHRCESHPAADQEPRQGDVDQRHVLLLRQLVDHPVDVLAEEKLETAVQTPANVRVRAQDDRGRAWHVTKHVKPDQLLGPGTVNEVVDDAEVRQDAPAEDDQLRSAVQEQLHPEELNRALGPTLHGAEVVRVHLGDAGADRLLHVHAALAPAEVLVRGGGVFDLGARLEVFEIDGLVGLPAEVHRVDLPHRVGPAGGYAAAPVPDDVHDVERGAIEHVKDVVFRLQVGEVLGSLHHRDFCVDLVGKANAGVLHKLGQYHAPEVRVRLVTSVEDAEEHALWGRVLLEPCADEAVAELQHVDREIQAPALAPHADVRHQQALLHHHGGVAVHEAPLELPHHQVAVDALADLLDHRGGPRDVCKDVQTLLRLRNLDARHVLLRVEDQFAELLAKGLLERLGLVLAVVLDGGEEELQAGLGRVRDAHHVARHAPARLLRVLQRHQAHALRFRALAAGARGVAAHELQQRGRGVVEDEHLLVVRVHVLPDDLAVAEAAHLPVGLHAAVRQVRLCELPVAADALLGAAVAAARGLVEQLQELPLLALEHAVDHLADLVELVRRASPRLQQGLLLSVHQAPAPELPARAALACVRLHGARLEARPQVLVQAAGPLDAPALALGLGAGHVDHDHLAVTVCQRLAEQQRELGLNGVTLESLVVHLLPLLVCHHQEPLVRLHGLDVGGRLGALLDLRLDFLLPVLAVLDAEEAGAVPLAVGCQAQAHLARQDAVVLLAEGGLHLQVAGELLVHLGKVLQPRERVLLQLHAALRHLLARGPHEGHGLVGHHGEHLAQLAILPCDVEGRPRVRLLPGHVPEVARPLLQEGQRRAGVQEVRPGEPEEPSALAVALVREDVDPPPEGGERRVVELWP
mmetsp:Transcript_20882/g.55966  ORF Transcript_20882/g.55966 Transcript_20882/m.55966 type:complete len:933 (+) Transcript_20882:714-3512(+)